MTYNAIIKPAPGSEECKHVFVWTTQRDATPEEVGRAFARVNVFLCTSCGSTAEQGVFEYKPPIVSIVNAS